MGSVEVCDDAIVVRELESRDPEVVAFFADVPAESRTGFAARALSLGVTGLSAVGVAGQAQVVEREFRDLMRRFEEVLGKVEGDMLRNVRETFDPQRRESVSGQLSAAIAEAHGDAKRTVEGANEELRGLIAESFNPTWPRATPRGSALSYDRLVPISTGRSTRRTRAATSPGWWR